MFDTSHCLILSLIETSSSEYKLTLETHSNASTYERPTTINNQNNLTKPS